MPPKEPKAQITAQDILLQAYQPSKAPTTSQPTLTTTKLTPQDLEELHQVQRSTRQSYEDALRRNKSDLPQWIRYAEYELTQHETARARSIFERALEVNPHYVPIWIRYIDSELKLRNVNHARNLLIRATELLPRVDKLWYKYVQTEEYLQNLKQVRIIFDKWITWEPDFNVWDAYVDFERRYDKYDNVRAIYSKYAVAKPELATWLKWIKFETRYGDSNTVRQVYSLGIDNLLLSSPKEESDVVELIKGFVSYEAGLKEYERAKAIVKFGEMRFPDSKSMKECSVEYHSRFGDVEGIEDSIAQSRILKYEQDLKEDARDYDTWWALLTLTDSEPLTKHRQRFIDSYSIIPLSNTKDSSWRRFIYLPLRHAIYEELQEDPQPDQVRSIYENILKMMKSHGVNFSKVWISYAKFEIRQKNLAKARKILGRAIGTNPKMKIFKEYIQLEIKLKEFDRVRKVYEKALETFPTDVDLWIQYASFEEELGDVDRSREIHLLALEFCPQEKQETIFKSLVEFEMSQREYTKVRELFEQQIQMDPVNVQDWINYANVELTIPTEEQIQQYEEELQKDEDIEFEIEITEDAKARTRAIFERAIKFYKSQTNPEARATIYQSLYDFETQYGDVTTQTKIQKRMPSVVKKIEGDRESWAFVFPDDEKFKGFLKNAKKWAKNKESAASV